MATKNKYATAKLDWAKKQLEKWETYIEENPYDKVEDRIRLIEKKDGKGVMPITAATIEQQHKSQRDTMKEYLELLTVVKKLESDEEAVEGKSGYAGVGETIRMKLAEKDKGHEE